MQFIDRIVEVLVVRPMIVALIRSKQCCQDTLLE